MNLRFSKVVLLLGLFLAIPAQRTSAQDAPAGTDGPRDGLAACVRGRVITMHEVEQEAARIQKLVPDSPWKELMLFARASLAERVILAETAKRFASMITDDAIQRHFMSQGMDLNDILDNFEILKEGLLIDLYIDARLGEFNLEGVVPDLAFYIRVTPNEIRSFYRNNPDEFTIPSRTVLLRILFPATAFPDPGLRREAAAECVRLLEDPAAIPADGSGDLKVFKERWPGSLPKTETLTAGEDAKFLPPVMEFIENAGAGEVSKVIELAGGVVVVRVLEKTEGRLLPFDEIKDKVAESLKNFKERNARRIIIEDLKRKEKVFWPRDLFDPFRTQEKGRAEDDP